MKNEGDEDEEEEIILEYRPDPLTVINTPIQDHVTPLKFNLLSNIAGSSMMTTNYVYVFFLCFIVFFVLMIK
jgi:hypothetical protein